MELSELDEEDELLGFTAVLTADVIAFEILVAGFVIELYNLALPDPNLLFLEVAFLIISLPRPEPLSESESLLPVHSFNISFA